MPRAADSPSSCCWQHEREKQPVSVRVAPLRRPLHFLVSPTSAPAGPSTGLAHFSAFWTLDWSRPLQRLLDPRLVSPTSAPDRPSTGLANFRACWSLDWFRPLQRLLDPRLVSPTSAPDGPSTGLADFSACWTFDWSRQLQCLLALNTALCVPKHC